MILFGSCRQDAFHLDTVFIVSHWIDHDRTNYKELLRGKVSDTYAAVTLSPWYQSDSADESPGCGHGCPTVVDRSYRLYFGATYENQVDGMFSFFPCLPYSQGMKGFERPTIRLEGVITDHLQQGKKFTYHSTTDTAILWEQVRQQVIESGLLPGVQAALPVAQ